MLPMNSKTESALEIFKIQLPDGSSFPCRSDESVLEAMQRSGNAIVTFGCFGGGCGVCAMQIVSGKYHQFKPMSSAHVTNEQQAGGQVLLCCVKPLSDLSLDFRGYKNNNNI